MWTVLRQQQQRGVQLPEDKRRLGEAPAEATEDRAAQDHEHAGGDPGPGNYPASRIEEREGDVTPTAPEPSVEWDEVVQPEKAKQVDFDKQPLPEGK
jgi:hypothetical protein